MKITTTNLRQIVKEEIRNVLTEMPARLPSRNFDEEGLTQAFELIAAVVGQDAANFVDMRASQLARKAIKNGLKTDILKSIRNMSKIPPNKEEYYMKFFGNALQMIENFDGSQKKLNEIASVYTKGLYALIQEKDPGYEERQYFGDFLRATFNFFIGEKKMGITGSWNMLPPMVARAGTAVEKAEWFYRPNAIIALILDNESGLPTEKLLSLAGVNLSDEEWGDGLLK